jgi:hypothetical protein
MARTAWTACPGKMSGLNGRPVEPYLDSLHSFVDSLHLPLVGPGQV